MTRHKPGFTLIEIIVVVAIISILVTILAPSLLAGLRWAKRAVCSSRLETTGKGMVAYASVNDEYFPIAPAKVDGSTTWGGRIGTNRTSGTSSSDTQVSGTRSPWLLVIGGQVPVQSFVCPATYDEPDACGASDYDFSNGNHISYSFQMPYGPKLLHLEVPSGLAIAADKNPWFDNASGGYSDPGIGAPQANNPSNNSFNHVDQSGQNVLYPDSHVSWEETPNAGIDGDHIYSRFSGANRETGTNNSNNLTIVESEDSFLAP